jgi:hypothetical protein
LRVRYPGLKAIDVGIPLLERTMEIVGEGQLEKVIWDRWFSVGALLDYLDKYMDLKYVTILRMHQNRIEDTDLRNYEGTSKLIVIRFEEDGEEKYYGDLTNDMTSTEETIIEEYDPQVAY